MVGRIYHVGLTVSDLERSIAFYRDVLGLEFQGEIFMEGEETDKMFRRVNCNPDNKDRTEYVKSIFNNDYTELTLEDGRTVGYKTFENVLHLWEGKYDSRTAQSFYDWAVIARHFEAMRLLGELSDSIKPLWCGT